MFKHWLTAGKRLSIVRSSFARLLLKGRKNCQLSIVISMMMTACNSELADDVTATEELQVSVGIVTRAATTYDATTFDAGKTIGISLEQTATNYTPFQNVAYTTNGTTWSPATGAIQLRVGDTNTRGVAYYPYKANTNPAAIPITCDTETDWMYSTWSNTVHRKSHIAAFEMHHAQTVIVIEINSSAYTDTGDLDELTIESDAFGLSGTLNATNGTLSSVNTANITQTYTSANVRTTSFSDQFYVLTTGQETSLTVTLSLDGRTIVGTVTGIQFEQGMRYTFEVVVNNGWLAIRRVTIVPWDVTHETDKQEFIIQDPT